MVFESSHCEMYNKINKLKAVTKQELPLKIQGGFTMSQQARNQFIDLLCDKTTMNREEVLRMSDAEVEYFHWLYFDDSPADLMM